ncbi:hypothetical protein IVB45_17330 [Bradyrhizobium sp. 4]|uniref:hypothetical protein n=1 Tax=unclassified Bradyrhizobium TaxID=2631580 RepID=UPI001FFBF711|nr:MULTISPECIES: hypothetical protein [unclassified Bradyrhizobium]MCK1402063.1 hypothetical protein [Bradyrhizobium sp. 39]MCK1751217.1 hypothetical protein [Bradyrhizobium sp. 135]UPJ38473.1 hypothetical protein IVB45_17330 [Bradyrhizobium sp. 4]
MTALDIELAARHLTPPLMSLLKDGLVAAIGIDVVRAAAAGYIVRETGQTVIRSGDLNALETALLRKIIGAVG